MSSKLDAQLQEQSYEIIDELQIRKKLEADTDWKYEFTKGGTYDYDLELHRWPSDASSQSDRQRYGYIELERADHVNEKSWVSGSIPDSWPFLTFLKRKIFEWDKSIASREGSDLVGGFAKEELKPKYRRALYLKYNHAMDNCFIAPIPTIVKDGTTTPRSDGTRTNSYLALNRENSQVKVGTEACVNFIDEYLSGYAVEQRGLEEFQ